MPENTTDGPSTIWDVTVGPGDGGERLDKFLAAQSIVDVEVMAADAADEADAEVDSVETPEPPLSRARLQDLIKHGAVVLLGQAGTMKGISSAKVLVKTGETYRVTRPAARPAVPLGEAIALTIVHEDRDLIVVDKPAGLVVHPGNGNETGTLVNALIAHCGDSLSGIGGVKRPGIVHRLDKDTSGLLVIAKNDRAHQSLSEQFQAHGADGRLVRRYLALAWGGPDRPTGSIDAAIARSHSNRTKMTVVREESGRHAVTRYEVKARFLPDTNGAALVTLMAMTLETGRTHQIRVHLAHIGHPILGDATYGASHQTRTPKLPEAAQTALAGLKRQALHAAELGFEHPRTGKILHFISALPADMAALLAALGSPGAVVQTGGKGRSRRG
jgi:23S rRNA pseudouridine1911/1915/1917 synthase